MSPLRVLTGITTSGTPHLGNYVGAIRPAVRASLSPGAESFYFLADYHALIKVGEPARIQRSTLEIAATWLAAGLALGPRLISPALWLSWVWDREHGVQAPAFSDIDDFNTVAFVVSNNQFDGFLGLLCSSTTCGYSMNITSVPTHSHQHGLAVDKHEFKSNCLVP